MWCGSRGSSGRGGSKRGSSDRRNSDDSDGRKLSDFILPVRVGKLEFLNDDTCDHGYLTFAETKAVSHGLEKFGKIEGSSPRISEKLPR